jgi:surface antigen
MSIKFTPRTKKPEAGNKYYIRKAQGGYSDAVQGSPTDKDCNVLSNCVGYAYGRFNEIGGWGYCKYLAPVNAKNFMDYKGSCKTGMTPKVGSCMVWTNERAGHVAIVEKVISSSEIITSESEWGGRAFYTMTRKKGDGNWGYGGIFLGFIYNPAELEPVEPVVAKTYELVTAVPTFNNANDAKNHTNANKITYGPGIYYIFNKYPSGYVGMYNLTEDKTGNSAGAWINPADNVKPAPPKPVRKYKVGDIVTFKYIFEKSTTTKKLIPAITQGEITRVLEDDVPNPYLIEEGNIGWTNEESITGLVAIKNEDKPKEEETKPIVNVDTEPKQEEPKEDKPIIEEEVKPEPTPEEEIMPEPTPEPEVEPEEKEIDYNKIYTIIKSIFKFIISLFKENK